MYVGAFTMLFCANVEAYAEYMRFVTELGHHRRLQDRRPRLRAQRYTTPGPSTRRTTPRLIRMMKTIKFGQVGKDVNVIYALIVLAYFLIRCPSSTCRFS